MTSSRQEAPPLSSLLHRLRPWPVGHDLAQTWASEPMRTWTRRMRALCWGVVTAVALLLSGLGYLPLGWEPTAQQMTWLVWTLSIVPIGLWMSVLIALVLSPRRAYRPRRFWNARRALPPHYRPLAFRQEHGFILLLTTLWIWPVITALVLGSGVLIQPHWAAALTTLSVWVCFALQLIAAAFGNVFTTEHDPKDAPIAWGEAEWLAFWRTTAELWLRLCCSVAPLVPLRIVWRTTLTLLAAGRTPEQIPPQVIRRLHHGDRFYWKVLLQHEDRSIRQWAIQEMGAAAARASSPSTEQQPRSSAQ